MDKTKRHRFLLGLKFVVLAHCLELVLCGGVWLVLDNKAVNAVANRLNIAPTWQSLAEYIGENFKVGMSRDEIQVVADEIGPYSIRPLYSNSSETCEWYYFEVGPLYTNRGGSWIVCFDAANDIVVSVEQYFYI